MVGHTDTHKLIRWIHGVCVCMCVWGGCTCNMSDVEATLSVCIFHKPYGKEGNGG